eukprot:COSAG01_NODE_2102_length_8419_cov_42.585216_6_plen_388_part_00
MCWNGASIEERDEWIKALDSLLRAAVAPSDSDSVSAARELALDGGDIHSVASESLKIEDVYDIGDMLGSGVAGEVHRAVHRHTNAVVAIKTISKRKFLVNERSVQTTRREIDIMKRLSSMDTRHPHVVDLYAVIETADNLYIVMELVEGGELFDYVIDHGPYSEPAGRDLMRKLVSTLGFLHSQGIVHRDLKPENILLSKDRSTDIKITDFGLANIMSASSILRSKCGTPVYMAPEMLQNRPYNESVDVWAAGILLYILLSGTLPFYADDPDEFLELVLSSSFSFPDEEWGHMADEVKDLIRKILVPDPKRRLTVRQILAHPWFTQGVPEVGDCLESAKQRLEFNPRRKLKGAGLAVKAAHRLLNADRLGSIGQSWTASQVEAPPID